MHHFPFAANMVSFMILQIIVNKSLTLAIRSTSCLTHSRRLVLHRPWFRTNLKSRFREMLTICNLIYYHAFKVISIGDDTLLQIVNMCPERLLKQPGATDGERAVFESE